MKERLKNKIKSFFIKITSLKEKIKKNMTDNKDYILWIVSYLVCLSPLLLFAFIWKYSEGNELPWVMMFSFYVISTLIFIFALLKPNFKSKEE
ncbi:MAG: hypothetical protein WC069_01860 [Candidatus Shapirobacteria bacterium]